ncbi:RING-type E3 ubiquitin transferase [Sarracenia purpurea var. burkii]
MADDDDSSSFFPSHRKSQYDLNSKIMLTAIVSLSVVVVIVTLLHIYARCVLRRHARRRAAMRLLRLSVSHPNGGGEPPKTGLDPSVIAALPIFVFKHAGRNDETETSGSGGVECAVCLSFLEEEEMARLLPNCNHTFHAECIDKWLSSQPTCPICRAEVEPHRPPQLAACEAAESNPPPSAPPLERATSTAEETSGGGVQSAAKIGGGSSSRLNSFRKILSRERSSRRIQSGGGGDQNAEEDVERQ